MVCHLSALSDPIDDGVRHQSFHGEGSLLPSGDGLSYGYKEREYVASSLGNFTQG
jgi:hypothetical protein